MHSNTPQCNGNPRQKIQPLSGYLFLAASVLSRYETISEIYLHVGIHTVSSLLRNSTVPNRRTCKLFRDSEHIDAICQLSRGICLLVYAFAWARFWQLFQFIVLSFANRLNVDVHVCVHDEMYHHLGQRRERFWLD